MKVKTRTVLAHVIERGIDYGFERACKHTDNPDKSRIKESIETEVWNEIDEVFDIEDQRTIGGWIKYIVELIVECFSRVRRIGGEK